MANYEDFYDAYDDEENFHDVDDYVYGDEEDNEALEGDDDVDEWQQPDSAPPELSLEFTVSNNMESKHLYIS